MLAVRINFVICPKCAYFNISIYFNMALDIDDTECSILTTAPTDLIVPTRLQHASVANFHSIQNSVDLTTAGTDDIYAGFPWSQFPQYSKAEYTKGNWSSWTWKYSYRLQDIKTEQIYWFCKLCI